MFVFFFFKKQNGVWFGGKGIEITEVINDFCSGTAFGCPRGTMEGSCSKFSFYKISLPKMYVSRDLFLDLRCYFHEVSFNIQIFKEEPHDSYRE